MRIAICYYGLTRSTRYVYKTHIQNLFNTLKAANIEFDTFVHTWTTKAPTTWNGADTSPVNTEEAALLNPTLLQVDDEDVFIASIPFSDYHDKALWEKLGDSRAPGHEWHPTMVMNHICLMEAMRRTTKLCLDSGKGPYDFILYMRPDVEVVKKFPVACLEAIGPQDAAILSYKHFEGYNTNVILVPYSYCLPFANRIQEAAEYRRTQGRLVTEKYTKYILDKYYKRVHQIDFPVNRVRSNGERIESN